MPCRKLNPKTVPPRQRNRTSSPNMWAGALSQMPLTRASPTGLPSIKNCGKPSLPKNMNRRGPPPSMPTTPPPPLSRPYTRPWKTWASRAAISWNPPAAWAISSVCCRRKCGGANCTAWNWIPSPGASQNSSIPKQTSLSRAFKPPTGGIFMI